MIICLKKTMIFKFFSKFQKKNLIINYLRAVLNDYGFFLWFPFFFFYYLFAIKVFYQLGKKEKLLSVLAG